MRLLFRLLPVLSLLCLFCSALHAQDSLVYQKLHSFPEKVFAVLNKKTHKIAAQLEKQTEKYLVRLAKQERKLQQKLWRRDSTAAKELFADVLISYAQLKKRVPRLSVYSGRVDSVQTALRFLQQHDLLKVSPLADHELSSLLNNYQSLQGKLNYTAEIKNYLKQRHHLLKQHLEKFGLSKEFKKFEKNVYYYRAQIDEYKRMLDEPSKLQGQLLKLANGIPAFKKFFESHSELARLFKGTVDYGSTHSLQGLQVRSDVQQMLQQRIGSGDPGAQQIVQQSIAEAQSELRRLKESFNAIDGTQSDTDLPEFRINPQRSKPFLKRLEFGTNFQMQRSRSYFPTTTDIGLSVAYKINDRSGLGLGWSYKLGLGNGWHSIRFSHQGISLRAFADWRIKGSFFFTASLEENYQAAFRSVEALRNRNAWQVSALAGISKKYRINNKLKGNLQLFFNFNHKRQIPSGQPLIFRMGYNL